VSIGEAIIGESAYKVGTTVLRRGWRRFTEVIRSNPNIKKVKLCLRHRGYTTDDLRKAFSSGVEVLFVSIMSGHTVKQLEPYLEMAKRTRTHIKALTWDPDTSPDTVENFRRHLGESESDPTLTLRQVRDAANHWDGWQKRYPEYSQIKYFRSTPTMQGYVVTDQWALVELIPYRTQPNERPALLLTKKSDAEAFGLFSDRFQKLWGDN